MYDVAIIGAGIVGAATAYELSKFNLKVVVIEKENDVSLGTTKANSAIIHAGYDPAPGSWMAKLNVRGTQIAPELCKKLGVQYRNIGSMVLAFDEKEILTIHKLYERGTKNGVPGLEILSGEEVRKREPNISENVVAALYAPSAGIVDPWGFAIRLMETAVTNGVDLKLNAEVRGVEKTNEGFTISCAVGQISCKYIFNAAGVHADNIHNMVAKPTYNIIPNRGEYYMLDKSEGSRVSHVVFQCPTEKGKGVLVSPTTHGNLIVGPNAEDITDPDDVATTRKGLDFVAQSAYKSVPSVDIRQSIRNFSGVRALTERDDFIIEQAPGAEGFFDLAGIKSPGLSAAPAIAEQAVVFLKESGAELTKKDSYEYLPLKVKFSELNDKQKAEITKQRPEYGRVVCRCVTVTEGEILDAMHSVIPPASIEGVKRRCDAGMGRCQGGFCGPRITDMFISELGYKPQEVLLDKTGTFILTGETKEV